MDILGFKFGEGDRVSRRSDGKCGVVTKSYCIMRWGDEFRVVVKFDDGEERDLPAEEVKHV